MRKHLSSLGALAALMACLMLVFTFASDASANTISWKGKVNSIGVSSAQGSQGPQDNITPLANATISLVSNPTVKTTSDANGIFELRNIPANSFQWLKVSKAGTHVSTNIGVQFGNVNVDSTNCGPNNPCNFDEELFAISNPMVNYLSNYFKGNMDSTRGTAIFQLETSNGFPVMPNPDPAITINGVGPLNPDMYGKPMPNIFVIPNISIGEATMLVEGSNLNLNLNIKFPVFAGEMTFVHHIVVDQSAQRSISGTVQTENSQAIPGANIIAIPMWGGKPVVGITDQNGAYTLKVIADIYKVQAQKDGYAPQFYNMTERWDWASPVNAFDNISGINFSLSTAYKITGRVTANGQPVANVLVNAWSQDLMSGAAVPTDDNGTYTIYVKPANDYRVSVVAQGFVEQFYNGKSGWSNADLVSVTTADRTNINFALSSGKTISGRVVQIDGTYNEVNCTAQSPCPIPNAWVNAWSDSMMTGSSTSTDSYGNYSLTVSDAPDYKVGVSSPNIPYMLYKADGNAVMDWMQATPVNVTTTSKTGIDIKITTQTTGTITGKVTGTNVSGLTVNAFSPMGFASDTTKTDGSFTIKVPAGAGYRIEVFSNTVPRVMWQCASNFDTVNQPNRMFDANELCADNKSTTKWDDATMINVAVGQTVTINIPLASGISISGVVKEGNKALPNVWVNAWSDTAQAWGGGQTNNLGVYSFTVPKEDGYKINISDPNYPTLFYSGSLDGSVDNVTSRWDLATVFNLKNRSDNVTSIDFNLVSGGSISGIVRANGRPVAGVWVNAFSDEGFGNGAPTTDNGTYTIKLPAGKYRLEVFSEIFLHQYYNGKQDFMQADIVTVADGQNVTGINFNLSRGLSISGTVRNSQNQPLKDIWVNAWSDTEMVGNGAMTDAQGKYSINLRPGKDYRVSVWHPDYVQQFYNNKTDWNLADAIDLSTSPVENVNFVLSSGNTIKGTVLLDNNSVPPVDIYGSRGWVNAWSERTGISAGSPIKDDGSYEIKVQPASDFRVSAWHQDYGTVFYDGKKRFDNADLVDATNGADNINLKFDTGRTISGVIYDENNNPMPNVWVNAWSEDIWAGGGDMTDAQGQYTIKGLVPNESANDGGYRISVNPMQKAMMFYANNGTDNATPNWNLATLVNLYNASASNISMKLSEGRSIKGKIKASAGELTGNIWVDAFSETLMVGRGELYIGAGVEVAYELKGLPSANDYKVHVHASEFGDRFYKQGSSGTPNWNEASAVDISSGNADNIDIFLSAGASISGTIYHTSKSDANKVGYGWVQAMNPQAGEYYGSPVNFDGTYSIKGLTLNQKYTVQAMSADYIPMFYGGSTSTQNWVEPNVIATEAGTKSIDIVLSKGNVISGRVFQDNSTNKASVPYANVAVFKANEAQTDEDMSANEFVWATMTDGAGNYTTMPLAAGDYFIAAAKDFVGKGVYKTNLAQGFTNANMKVTISNADVTGKDIYFKTVGNQQADARYTLTVQVDNSTQENLKEVQVIVYDNSTTKKIVAQTSKPKTGTSLTFEIPNIRAGNYFIRVIAQAVGSGQQGSNVYRNWVNPNNANDTSSASKNRNAQDLPVVTVDADKTVNVILNTATKVSN